MNRFFGMSMLIPVFISGSLLMTTARAHHANSMFDMNRELEISGVVKAWQYTAPHSWLQVMTAAADGKQVLWSLEGGGPSVIMGALRKDTFKVGDKVTIKTHPMKDGRTAGTLGEVTFADGRVLKQGGPPPEAVAQPGAVVR